MTGHNQRRYRFTKRTHENQDLGPFISHEMNRCIACYRCVRYYNDYADGTDLGVFGANDNLYFGRIEDGILENEFSGNLTEVCPTGVFTDKTHSERYNRKWDMQFAPSICHGCASGCNISPGERYGELRRIENRTSSIARDFDKVCALLTELGIASYPKTTASRGVHVYARLEPRWNSYQVRAAAVAVARELERRRPDVLTAAWWKEERGTRIFVDYNQNAPHKTVFGAWSARARVGGQVSTPVSWDELAEIDPDELTIASVPARVERDGDPWADIAAAPQSIEPLLAMSERDMAAGLMDAPWPPVYPKQPNEPSRVAPSRARAPDA